MKRLEFMAAVPANDNRGDDRQADLFHAPRRILVGMDWVTGREIEILGAEVDGLLVVFEVLSPDDVKFEAA